MWYTHYMHYDRTKVDKLNPELDESHQPKSDEFRARRHKLQEATYKVCKEAINRWIALGNGNGDFRPVIHWPAIYINGSVEQPANEWTRQPKPMEVDKTAEFAGELAKGFGSDNVISMWSWLQRPDDSFIDWDGKPQRTGSRFAWSQINAPSIPNPMNNPFVDWSYETLSIETSMKKPEWDSGSDWKFTCTKTNFYPYDIVVTAIMAATQIIMGKDAVKVSSDWAKKDWMRGLLLLREATGLDVESFYLEWENIEILAALIQKRIGKKTYLRFKPFKDFETTSGNFETVLTKRGAVQFKDIGDYGNDRRDIRVLHNEVTAQISG